MHAGSGDIYQLARHRYIDESSGQVSYQCGRGASLENELATRALTILAMAGDGDYIIDPFDGREDLVNGELRHVAPDFVCVPQNLLTVALWAARLAGGGFSIAHETHRLMKKMVASGVIEQIQRNAITDAAIQAIASPRPSEFFRVLHRCHALPLICRELDALFEESNQSEGGKVRYHPENSLPDAMQTLDQAAAETGNISSVMKAFYQTLGDRAEKVFKSFGLDALM